MPSFQLSGPFGAARRSVEELLEKNNIPFAADGIQNGCRFKGTDLPFSLILYGNAQNQATRLLLQTDKAGLAPLLSARFAAAAPAEKKDKVNKALPPLTCRIGTDESGKGDFFGPLAVAGVFADQRTALLLAELGVKDSKTLTDKKISALAAQIREVVGKNGYSLLVIRNEKYNELYEKIGNLNRLLAWAHARVIENLLESHPACPFAVVDQFGPEHLVKRALMEKGRTLTLLQTPRAERETAVAAASILARDAFVAEMARLSEKCGLELQKGCSSLVARQAQFLYNQNSGILRAAAKLHFKTYTDLLK